MRKFVIISQVPARLDNRPLLGTVDADLFVGPTVMPDLQAAVDQELNVLLLGAQGSGKTSLLRALEASDSDFGRPSVYVDLGPAQTAEDSLLLVTDALGHPWGTPESFRSSLVQQRITPSAVLLQLVRYLGKAPPSLILVDSPPGNGESHTLFGRLRDELWQLPHQWVVAANEVLRDELTRAPASAFFDVQLQLRPFSVDQQRDLLERRLHGEEPRIDIDAMLGQTDGWPRSIIQLARTAVLSGVDDALSQREDRRNLLTGLPDAASLAFAYIADNGPTSGSDPHLLSELGVSGQRARQILRGLEDRGLLTSFSEQEDRRGRPRKLYDLSDEIAS